jgi:hypothetical protein
MDSKSQPSSTNVRATFVMEASQEAAESLKRGAKKSQNFSKRSGQVGRCRKKNNDQSVITILLISQTDYRIPLNRKSYGAGPSELFPVHVTTLDRIAKEGTVNEQL